MSIRAGHFIIHHPEKGKIRVINILTGDAGEFDLESFVAAINEWYDDHF